MDKKKKMYSPFEKQIFKEIIGKFDSALKNDTIRGNRPEAREDRNKLWDDIENEFNSVQGVTQVGFIFVKFDISTANYGT